MKYPMPIINRWRRHRHRSPRQRTQLSLDDWVAHYYPHLAPRAVEEPVTEPEPEPEAESEEATPEPEPEPEPKKKKKSPARPRVNSYAKGKRSSS